MKTLTLFDRSRMMWKQVVTLLSNTNAGRYLLPALIVVWGPLSAWAQVSKQVELYRWVAFPIEASGAASGAAKWDVQGFCDWTHNRDGIKRTSLLWYSGSGDTYVYRFGVSFEGRWTGVTSSPVATLEVGSTGSLRETPATPDVRTFAALEAVASEWSERGGWLHLWMWGKGEYAGWEHWSTMTSDQAIDAGLAAIPDRLMMSEDRFRRRDRAWRQKDMASDEDIVTEIPRWAKRGVAAIYGRIIDRQDGGSDIWPNRTAIKSVIASIDQ